MGIHRLAATPQYRTCSSTLVITGPRCFDEIALDMISGYTSSVATAKVTFTDIRICIANTLQVSTDRLDPSPPGATNLMRVRVAHLCEPETTHDNL